MRDGRCCGCCWLSPSAHPCRAARHPSGSPPQPCSSPLVRLRDVAQAGRSTRGRLSPEADVRCVPTLGISGEAMGAMEGGRDPAALRLCHPQGAVAAPGQPQPDAPPRPPSTKEMLLLFFSPSPNRVKHGSSGAGKMEPLSPSPVSQEAPTTFFPLPAAHLPFGSKKKNKKIKKR